MAQVESRLGRAGSALPALALATLVPARWQRPVAAAGCVALAVGAYLRWQDSARLGVALLIGAALGVALYHGAIGFSAAFRKVVARRDPSGMNAILFMVALTSLLFAPALEAGSILGRPVTGAFAPVGLGVAIGSAAFGVGMQLAGGCGSGTLFAVGGGSTRMLIVLACFCAGGFLATFHMGFWGGLPAWGPLVLGELIGWPLAVVCQLLLLGSIWLVLRALRRRSEATEAPTRRPHRWIRGPWAPLVAVAVLAGLNWLTLATAGHPWTITWGFTLWGAEAASFLGWSPAGEPFWSGAFASRALAQGSLKDVTSLMDLGIALGALIAAGLAGRFAPRAPLGWRSLAAAALGGLLMGYGARIAYGCNIGAFLGGTASTSLHGWLWLAGALFGSWIGVLLRPRFGLKT
jgi:uncharacterized membrane protein YedE/YeeE